MTLSDTQRTIRDNLLGVGCGLVLVGLTGWAVPFELFTERMTAAAAGVAILGFTINKLGPAANPASSGVGHPSLIWASLTAGVLALLLTATDLVTRLGQVAGTLLAGPRPPNPQLGLPLVLEPTETMCWLLLATAWMAGRWSLPARWWNTALFGLMATGVIRMAVTRPVWEVNQAGIASRSALTLTMMGLAGSVLCVFTVAWGRSLAVRRARWLAEDPTQAPPGAQPWPGFARACTGLGLFLILLVCYHLAIGFEAAPGGTRTVAGLVAGISVIGAGALLSLLRTEYDTGLADVGIALICLAFCCLAVVLVPDLPDTPVERYPLTLNAATIGLAAAVCFWTWLIVVWEQQLDHGQAWTVAGRLIRPAQRATFFAGLLGLVTATLMTAWPHLADAPGMDHSFARLTWGVAGHLGLIGAMLWSARKQRRSSLIALAILVVLSLMTFIYTRSVPLTTAAF